MTVATLLTSLFLAQLPADTSAQILYHVHHGDTKSGFGRYLEAVGKGAEHDYELLQQAATSLLERGASDERVETQLMCLLGAGVSLCPKLLPILEKGVHSKELQPQLVALNFLSRLDDDEADRLFLSALSSPYLLSRLEALFQLSKKNHPAVLEHLESLMIKVPAPIRPLFAQIVINLDTHSANQLMRRLLSDFDLATRCEAIMMVAAAKRDDFLPQIRILASQTQFIQQECAAFALGELKDRSSITLLRNLLKSKQQSVRQAAAFALYELGESEGFSAIIEEGFDLHTLALLGKIPTKEACDILFRFVKEGNRDMRLNALIGLLQQRDKRCIPYLYEVLLGSKRDIGYVEQPSAGGTIKAWKTISSASHKEVIYPAITQQSRMLREAFAAMTLELDEEAFLDLAKMVFKEEINELIPLCLTLLSNHRSEESLSLIKLQQRTSSSEFIKTYCDLTLYKLGIEGPYESHLIEWIQKRKDNLMICFREEVSSERQSKHSLAPEEQSLLLIESYEALAASQNPVGIRTLIHAIAEGNEQNRYALAGLLIRTTE